MNRLPRLGFLGLGWIGCHRLASLQASGQAEIFALADPEPESLARAATLVPGAAMGRTLEDLLALPLDGVVIATPSAQHAAETQQALAHGMAVFCQKPLGRNLPEVRRVLDQARAADRLLSVDLSYRHTAALQKIRSLVLGGELGRVYAVDLVFHNAYGPQKPWFFDRQLSGGGCVIDLGIHLVDAALWILGDLVRAVSSRLFRQGQSLPAGAEECEDYATARLDLASGAVVHLACSWNLPAGRPAVIEASFYGTGGGAALHNVNGSYTEFTAERFRGTERELLAEPPDEWGAGAALAWVSRLGRDPGYDPEIEQLLEVTAILDAIYAGGLPQGNPHPGAR